jgi:signal transduction histidine kinase
MGIKLIEKDKRYIYTLAFFYSMLVIIVVSIPAYFYISIEKKSYKENQIQNMEHYAYGVEKSIYDFSHTDKNIFDFPRSLFYNAYLFDTSGNKIFATNKSIYSLAILEKGLPNTISRTITLNFNRLLASKMIIMQKFSYDEIYYKALISALFLGTIIFFMTLFFIRISIKPLERLNRYLNIFFNDAMHELKTPLGVMQLNLEILKSKEDSKVLKRLYNSMQNMNLIYEDIEYHIKHTHVTYTPEQVDFTYFLKDRVDIFRDLASVKNIAIEESIAEDINVLINRVELQRIIDNTLSNAIKYSHKNTLVQVLLEKNGEKIIFSVLDEGVGIKDIKKVFERYKREDTVKGGFGIGLSIVKYICNKNNILIKVVTKKQQGSKFTYTFTNTNKKVT